VDQPLIGFALGNCALFGSVAGDIIRWILPFLAAAVALGFVIFVHELGHFAVAKMCGVKCEKFFLGFDIAGKKIWSFQWGETEYGIGILPLGGYVKMLGQDDNPTRAAEERERAKAKPAAELLAGATSATASTAAAQPAAVQPTAAQPPKAEHSAATVHSGDLPHEPTAEDHEAFDPRSYMAKSVPQRMAIISAGVIMNLIFAVIFAAIAYRCGVSYLPCVIGTTVPGDPAWTHDIRPGDRIIQLDGDQPSQHLRFDSDLMMGVLFNGPDQDLHLKIERPSSSGDERLDISLRPTDRLKDENHGRSMIGISPAETNRLMPMESPVVPGTPAAKADPAFAGGDTIVGAKVGGVEHDLHDGIQINALLMQYPDQPIKFTVERANPDDPKAPDKQLQITVAPTPLRDLGFAMRMGPIVAVRANSPAASAGFLVGDRIETVDGKPAGDPMLLPEQLLKLVDKDVAVEVLRGHGEGQPARVSLKVTPRLPNAIERAVSVGPEGCDSLGIAYEVSNTVAAVRPDAPDDVHQIEPGDKLVSLAIEADDAQKKKYGDQGFSFSNKPVEFGADHPRWPETQYFLQWIPADVKIKLTFKRGDKEISATVYSIAVAGTFYPDRGLRLEAMSEIRKADSWSDAFYLGWRETKESVFQIVTTVRKLASGGVSPTGFAGPIGIVQVATASASQGIPKLLIFLTLLSANLAVINFLPIPILDGGHMMFLLYEGIRGKPASERVQMYLTYLGLVFILTLMVFVIGLDITRVVKWVISLFSS
jgi:regulator of sigma E protease